MKSTTRRYLHLRVPAARLALGLLLVFPLLSLRAEAQLLQNLQASGVVDLLHPVSLDDAKDNRLDVRGAELSLFGPIDHIFDGTLTFAGHPEHGEFHFEVHEAFVGSSKLIPRSRFKLGKFLLGLGRLNQVHRHDWPFISAPKVQRVFLNGGRSAAEAEGAADTGLEYSVLLPLPIYLDLTMGVTNGYCFGHCHSVGQRPQTPLFYLRPTTFWGFEDGSGLQLGLNFLNHKDHLAQETSLTGLDLAYKRREGKTLKWLLQGEIWHRALNRPASGDTSTIGSYLYTQYGWSETTSFGLRLDGFSHLNRTFNTTGEKQKNFDYGLVPTVTYKPSEFSSLRLAYAHEVDTAQGESDIRDRRFELQFVYILGAHPAHDF